MKLSRKTIIILTLYTLLFVVAYNYFYDIIESHWDVKQEIGQVR